MVTLHQGSAAARVGADSVFRYLERAAQPVAEGVRWQTLDDAGAPQYRGDLYSNGGIPLFLADYFRLTGHGRALELAERGASWCTAPGREFLADRFATDNDSGGWGLLGGRAGVGMAWLRLVDAGGGATPLERATAVAAALVEREPGAATGLSVGAAGQGIFLLRLWERTRDARHLAGATRLAEWLGDRATWTDVGCRWAVRAEERQPAQTSICHGVAGVGYFFLLLHQATGGAQYATVARGAAGTLMSDARPDRGGLNWVPLVGATTDLDFLWRRVPVGAQIVRCQWCNGAPGIGLFFAKAYEVLRDVVYLNTARAAGEATYAYADGRGNPTYCHGLAGNAEVLIELYRLTGERLWLDRAHEFARRMLGYLRTEPEGETWPGDAPAVSGNQAADFLCGAAGVGHVFLRLLDPTGVRPALL